MIKSTNKPHMRCKLFVHGGKMVDFYYTRFMVGFKIVLLPSRISKCMYDRSLANERHLTRVISVQLILFRLLICVDSRSTVIILNAVHHFLMLLGLLISLIVLLRLLRIEIDELLLA